MASFGWEPTIVDPFTSFDNSTLIPILQDSYSPQSNPTSKDSLDVATANGATANSVSPPYSDSSPSPSSANDDGVSFLNDSRPNGDTNHKRRASPDNIEIDEQQSTSKSFTTQDGKLKRTVAPSRRKSGGERGHDESKLLKRKEQNRAAQRAFRERKEKHVKDLEDRVAQLEAKGETQAVENENLRDMIKRLQAENTLLRQQNSFSFSLPNGSGMPNAASSSTSFSLPEPGPSRNSRPDATSNASTQISGSSQPNFSSQYSTFDSSTPSTTLPDNSTTTLADVEFDLFGGPFTTVASNPMFMSYQDPAESMNAFASFGGFGGWDDMNLVNNFGQFNGLSTLNSGDITVGEKATSPVSPYDAQFQAALTQKQVSQEPCMIDQLCIDMQRKATCTALH